MVSEQRKMFRQAEILEAYRLPKSTMYLLISRGEFPEPAKIGRSSYWSAQEVAEWWERMFGARVAC